MKGKVRERIEASGARTSVRRGGRAIPSIGGKRMARILSHAMRFAWVSIFALLVGANAHAIDTLPGAIAARFTWAPASGDVGGYEVRVSVNDGAWIPVTRTKKTEILVFKASDDEIRVAVAAYDVLGVLGPQSPVSQVVHFAPPSLPRGRSTGPVFGIASRDIPIVGHWRAGARASHGVVFPGSQGWVFVSLLGSTVDMVEFGDIQTDEPIVGDWDGDGDTDPGVYRDENGVLVYDLKTDQGIRREIFGDASLDTPIIGDWDGNGTDDVGIYRAQGDERLIAFYLSLPGGQFRTVSQGRYDYDTPIAGDWNGDGVDDIGTARRLVGTSLVFYLRTPAGIHSEIMTGAVGGIPIVGDWNGDGADDVGVAVEDRRGQWLYEYLVLGLVP